MSMAKQIWRGVLVISLLTMAHSSGAVTWPAYCQQNGGATECTTDFKQAAYYTCGDWRYNVPSFPTATADECYEKQV